MRVLVTGASSYVGARLYVDLKDRFDVLGTYHSNRLFSELRPLDITDRDAVASLVSETRPDAIVHVAANPSASWCDAHPDEARAINAQGTAHVVEAANAASARIVYISSFAAVDPTTLYGETKAEGERSIAQTRAGFVILRPSLIVGSSPNEANDRPFNRLLKNLRGETPAVYDTSWKFQPTYLRHLSEVIVKTLEARVSSSVIPVAVPELSSRFELARDILSPFGIRVAAEDRHDVSPVFSNDLSELRELDLPRYSYARMIDAIVSEIEALGFARKAS